MKQSPKDKETDNKAESRQGPPPEIKLPFEGKDKQEAGEWVYDNRVSFSITIIIYLVLAIIFVSSKILIENKETQAQIVVDFSELERLEEELRRAEELNAMLNAMDDTQYGSVRNIVSNENASEERERLTPDTREIFDRSDDVLDRMDENRELYEQMLADLETQQPRPDDKTEREDVKVQGNVTVSFSFTNPSRNSYKLHIPAYKCRSGGIVVIDVVVNRNGEVLSAAVDKRSSTSDPCMTETAVDAALRSRFAVSSNAPSRHHGTIIYNFVPQGR